MQDPKHDPHAAYENLRRIADALGEPVDTFFPSSGDALRLRESAVLLKAFDTLTDRQARARCLAFIAFEVERAREP